MTHHTDQEQAALADLRRIASQPRDPDPPPVTPAQLVDAVAYVRDGRYRLDTIADRIGVDVETATDVLVAFGRWLGEGHGSTGLAPGEPLSDSQKLQLVQARDLSLSSQLPLFYDADEPAHRQLGHLLAADGTLQLRWGLDDPSLWRPISNILLHPVADRDIRRYLAKRSTRPLPSPSYALLTAVWQLLHWQRPDALPALAELADPPNHQLAGILLRSWRLLDIARGDAVQAVQTLYQTLRDSGDPQPAARDVWARCGPLQEGAVRDLGRALALPDPNAAIRRWFVDRVLTVERQRRPGDPSWVPARVADLTAAQADRFIRRAGYEPGDADDTPASRELTAELERRGLFVDAFLLRPRARIAGRHDLGDELVDAAQRLAAGELHWDEPLVDAVAAQLA